MAADRALSDRYSFVERLGFGGISEIQLVEDLELGERKALKILRPELGEKPEFASRFRREAKAIGRLDHPNIVRASDFGQLPDGRFFLALDYVPGVELTAILRERGRLALDRAVPILVQLADAIDHAHSRGVIHRDLKPSNILVVERDGRELVRVVDFGISKIVAPDYEDSVGSTQDGERWGSPMYMAPELITGRADDPRMDIYAAGCIAFELVAGQPPFTGSLLDVCGAHVDRAPLAPSLLLPHGELPEALDAVVLRCLEKSAPERYATGAELRKALEGVTERSG